jgi:hypothetical protein
MLWAHFIASSGLLQSTTGQTGRKPHTYWSSAGQAINALHSIPTNARYGDNAEAL